MGNRLIPTLATSTPPKASVDFFRRNPDHITPASIPCASIPPWLFRRVVELNRFLNERITFGADEKGNDFWQRLDFPSKPIETLLTGKRLVPALINWRAPGEHDCEDYTWTKRHALGRVFGYGCLSPIITTFEDGRGHMVLGLCASDTTWILDNLQDDVIEIKPAHRPKLMYANGAWCLCHIQEDTADA